MGLDMGFTVNGKGVVYMRKANMIRKFIETNASNFKDNGTTLIDATLIENLLETIEWIFNDDKKLITTILVIKKQCTDNKKYQAFVKAIDEMLKTVQGQVLVEKAKDYLPTQSGFFFGNVQYDAYYFLDLLGIYQDIKKHEDELTDPDNDVEYYEWY